MTRLKYERRFHGEGKWTPIGKSHLKEALRQNFEDVRGTVRMLDIGCTIETKYAEYRNRKVSRELREVHESSELEKVRTLLAAERDRGYV